MKRNFLAIATMAIMILLNSCGKETPETPNNGNENQSVEVYIDATSKTTWHYYSFDKAEFIASCEVDSQEDKAMKSCDDWDIAIMRYHVKTNSGTSTDIGKGGLYTCSEGVTFDNLTTLPADITYAVDQLVEQPQMSGDTLYLSLSTAVVAVMDGMPPTWLKSPLYIVKDGKGENNYKLDFISYKNNEGTSGHVSYRFYRL